MGSDHAHCWFLLSKRSIGISGVESKMKCVRRRVTVYTAGKSISILNSTQLRGAETFYLGLIEEHVGGEVVNSTAAERAHREICRTVEEEEGEEEEI